MHAHLGTPADGEAEAAREAIARQLRELPRALAPPVGWSELQPRSRIRTGQGPRAIALAACAALLAVAAAVTSRLNRSAPETERPAAGALMARLARPSAGDRAAQAPEAILARADRAERWLASEPDDSPIVRVSMNLAVTNLEDRVASMDDLLNLERLQHARAARLRALQLQRAQLVDSLAQVRYAEMLAEGAP